MGGNLRDFFGVGIIRSWQMWHSIMTSNLSLLRFKCHNLCEEPWPNVEISEALDL